MPDHSQPKRAKLREHRGDKYDTPPEAVHALLACETLPYRIWEPACGKGNIATILRDAGHDVLATDLNDRGCPDSTNGIDFLLPTPDEYKRRAIVTNPPYMLAEKFVTTALERVPLVVMLLRLAFLESVRRASIFDTGKLARVHVFANRLPFMHRATWTGKRASSGIAFGWYIWDRDHNGPATIDRIYWRPLPQNSEDEARFKMMGPEERRREEIKALNLPVDNGPLFGGADAL